MNLKATAHNEACDAALRIYGRVLEEVRGDRLVREAMRRVGDDLFVQGERFDLSAYRRVLVCAVGKAAVPMAEAAIESLGRVDGGLVVAKAGHLSTPTPLLIPFTDESSGGESDGRVGTRRGLPILSSSHPVPDEASLRAGEELLRLAGEADERDFVVFLLSGGASSLVESPIEGVSLEDLQATSDFLLRSGQPIAVMNAIRSRLSRIKAGGLARAFAPATVVVLVLSDVLGNRLETIGSGPFIQPRPGNDASILFMHSVNLPSSVRTALQAPRGIDLADVLPIRHFVIGSVSLAIQAAITASEELGLEGFGFADPLQGEAREAARTIARKGSEVLKNRQTEPFCLVFGGETTVTLGQATGKGGRCQEMALAIAPRLERLRGCAFLAGGTDGTDGPTDAAGATADPDTVSRAAVKGLKVQDALDNHDSYHFLQAGDNLIFTESTGSNVNDVALFVSV